MAKQAEKIGFNPVIKTNHLEGEARVRGRQIARQLQRSQSNTALLYGGETTSLLKEKEKEGATKN